jgi:hypothetical protein
LPHYVINTSPAASSHRFLIGPPLVVVSLFCFGFVLMQPHDIIQIKAASSNNSTLSSGTSHNPTTLPNAAQASLPKLEQEPVAGNPSPTLSTSTDSVSTSSPSTSKTANTPQLSSKLSATGLQGGGSNSQPATEGSSPKTLTTNVTFLINSLKLFR